MNSPSANKRANRTKWDGNNTLRSLVNARALLPTPSATPYGTNQGGGMGRVGPVRPSLDTMARTGLWPTPTAGDASGAGSRNLPGSKAHAGVSLTDAVLFGNSTTTRRPEDPRLKRNWPTPNSRDHKGAPGTGARERGGHQASLPGALKDSEGSGSLNPTFVAWLMGFPSEWLNCAPSETVSSPSLPSGSGDDCWTDDDLSW